MFTEQLNYLRTTDKEPLKQSSGNNGRSQLLHVDIQYQIYGTFMKHLGQKFCIKEAEMMESSKKFIDQYSSLRKKQLDSSQTQDTFMDDGLEASEVVDEDRSSGFNRRNLNLMASRKNVQQFSEQLSEIQRSCSYSCFSFFSILVAEYKKMQSKIKQIDSRQIIMSRLQQQKFKTHEQNIILKKKLEHQKQTIQHLQAEVQTLRLKNKSINSCFQEKMNHINSNNKYFDINQKVYKDIRNYLLQKQNALKIQHEKINQTENTVISSITEAFKDDSCAKCCEILRKLKESIIKYKRYLQGQSLQFQKLYDKYKKTMYSLKSRQPL